MHYLITYSLPNQKPRIVAKYAVEDLDLMMDYLSTIGSMRPDEEMNISMMSE